MQEKLYSHRPKKSNSSCPSCGFHISHSSTFESVLSGQFDNTRNGGYTALRSTPVRASTIESDVLVPLAQSVVWSIVSILPAISISYVMRYEWYFPLAVGSASLLVSWLSAVRKSESSLVTVEEFSYSPNDEIAAPLRAGNVEGVVKLEIKDKSENYGASLKIVQLPAGINESDWNEFCRDILAGRSLARSNWTGNGKLFSRDLYDQLMAKMEEAGLVASVAGKGRRLTLGGKGAIKAMIRTRRIAGN